jgi:hypothetical protein
MNVAKSSMSSFPVEASRPGNTRTAWSTSEPRLGTFGWKTGPSATSRRTPAEARASAAPDLCLALLQLHHQVCIEFGQSGPCPARPKPRIHS